MPRLGYTISCVHADGADITQMVDRARTIGYRTFMRNVRRSDLEAVFPCYNWSIGNHSDLRLKDDYHVSYHSGRYQGRRCYYIKHSAIEYVFASQ